MGHSIQRLVLPSKKIVVITAASGTGKSSIVKKLLEHHKNYAFSVSATTREKRTGEVDGVHYHFLTTDQFKSKTNAGDFIEYEEVYPGQFYGTLKSEVERIWSERKIALFDIDVKGAVKIKEQFGKDCLTIFLKPDSIEQLEQRLKNRNTETKDSLKKRLQRAKEELSYESKFDVPILNRDFDTAYMRVKNAILSYLKQSSGILVH